VSFDAPRSSPDGGAVLLRCLDERAGWSRRLAECLTERRQAGRIRHSLHEQVRQRLFQIALGYEDCNDADRLRKDPVLLTVSDRSPDDAEGLSSQPTLSRFGNGVGGRVLRRLLRRFEEDYVASLAEDTEQVVLDIDSTHDPAHGQQELALFHGFYDQRIYHPLLVFDGKSGQLITALLRPGRTHASRWARAVLRRLIRRIKDRLPEVRILVRGNSHFAMPAILEELERLDAELGGVDFVLGLAPNAVLVRWAQRTLEAARRESERTGSSARRFTVDVESLMDAIDEPRARVWRAQPLRSDVAEVRATPAGKRRIRPGERRKSATRWFGG